MTDQLMVVQFPHPGAEHRPTGSFMGWNRSDHARKFLRTPGEYLDGGALRRAELVLWGEWEAPSRVIGMYLRSSTDWPRYLHAPIRAMLRTEGLLQNTDPLVFGDTFLYSNCRQGRNRKLRELAPGSLVLFGSDRHGEFVLDTVFVVGDGHRYSRATATSVEVDPWVRKVVLDPLSRSAGSPDEPFRLYRGRRWEGETDEPFSFVPCMPADAAPLGFARPTIRLDRRWLTPRLRQGAKATIASAAEIDDVWSQMVDQVTHAGLYLGVAFDVPPVVSGEGE